jgi:hypothetical protein
MFHRLPPRAKKASALADALLASAFKLKQHLLVRHLPEQPEQRS